MDLKTVSQDAGLKTTTKEARNTVLLNDTLDRLPVGDGGLVGLTGGEPGRVGGGKVGGHACLVVLMTRRELEMVSEMAEAVKPIRALRPNLPHMSSAALQGVRLMKAGRKLRGWDFRRRDGRLGQTSVEIVKSKEPGVVADKGG